MFYNLNCSTKAGMSYNEDSIFYNENMMIVVDAATDLTKTHLTDEPSDGCWFSKHATLLLSKQLCDTSLSIPDALERVAFELKNELDALGYANIPEAYPSASIMITRIIDDNIDFFP